ncbi:MAG: phosphoribosylaminoimidazole succinocarboxamide synthase [Halobacteriovoraceae bacterium]|nr:phosphoribosylaminoimidazole succinocarboxamide synthase [Halobacteriovoraceae bacterium]
MLELIKRGSVKDIYQDGERLFFHFSDRYSIFDWGEMPDLIEDKGKCLLEMAKIFFETIQNNSNINIHSHFLGIAHIDGKNLLEVKKVEVPEIKKNNNYDYSYYKNKPVNCLVPLEVVFRFGIPQGSSLMKRASDKNYLKSIGIQGEVKEGMQFEQAIIEFSTKLESEDRYITYQNAQQIAGMTNEEFIFLIEETQKLCQFLKETFSKGDMELWDGKFEFAFLENPEKSGLRQFMLVDSIGPDELRILQEGTQLSKQRLREFYKDTDWKKDVDLSKKMASERGVQNWKEICVNELKSSPDKLNQKEVKMISQMYRDLTDHISKTLTGKTLFS